MTINSMTRSDEDKKAIHFRHLNVDYSEYIDNLMHGSHIARFIRQNIIQGIPLKLSTNKSSGVHQLEIVSNNQSILFFIDDMARFQVHDVFYRHQCIVDLPHFTTFMYYAKEIIKNITFCHHLINGDTTYQSLVDKLDNTEFIFKELIVNSFDNEYGIDVNYTDDTFSIFFTHYNIVVALKINRQNDLLNFSFTEHNNNLGDKKTIASHNFHLFICRANKTIYSSMVEDRLNIPAKEFTINHREIVKMYDI